jgi:4-hydroxy-3-methylbut-2-enyl diphosphate reductase
LKVALAERIGFCFGVKRAVNLAEAALKNNSRIYSLGSIIHNEQVVKGLAKKGLKVIKDIKYARGSGAVVVISSHGISPRIAKRIRQKGLRIIDTTCPFVLNAQKIARRLASEGYRAIIVGDMDHPEVKALLDFAPKGATVIKDRVGAATLKFGKDAKVSVLSQTTQSSENFLNVVRTILEKRPKELKVCNTICNDAEKRQLRASSLASRVELMLVVGGTHSANTRRLYEVCKKTLRNTHLVETDAGLRKAWFKKVRSVGIASGASTPDWIVQKVVSAVRSRSNTARSRTLRPKTG